jgi:hypothetical protein
MLFVEIQNSIKHMVISRLFDSISCGGIYLDHQISHPILVDNWDSGHKLGWPVRNKLKSR